MTPERKTDIEALFEAALERPPVERPAWLDQVCGSDRFLHEEVRQLLAAHARADGILEHPLEAMAALFEAPPERDETISRVGPYRLVREIGRGGMGTVYLAERDDGQFEQRVAVKVLRRGLDTDDVVRRFIAERQILATLQHPNIARLLDGGVAADGRPYFVMEYTPGEPIDMYCDARRLSTEARLRLFCAVARAVQYAHRALVVHRDLKPSNILVTEEGEVKLLDFGIAKLLDPTAASHTVPLTATGLRLMTPEYASPEQVRGEQITTASDVYGLGVVLYELLCGHRPYRLAGRSLGEIERILLTEEPARPSTAVTRAEDVRVGGEARHITPEQVSQARDTDPARLRRTLSGDLDRIVLTAIHKEPERRYPSAERLAEDVERYLSGRPVRARGDSGAYRARKFVRRHRWSVAAAAAFVLVLAGYAVTVTVQARQIKSALTEARLQADKAEQVTAFTMGLFEAENSARLRGDTLTVRELLRQAVQRAERAGGQPTAQAQMFDVVGRVYQRLGDYATAQPFLERALALRRRHSGEGHTVAESMYHLATLLVARGQYAPAESLYREALALQRALVGERHPTIARTLSGLATLLRPKGDYQGAERLTRGALAMRRELFGNEHPEVAQSLNDLAHQLRLQGRYDEAESLYREALAMQRRFFGDEHPEVASAMSRLGLVIFQSGRTEPAESLYRSALAMRRRFFGDEHPDVALSLGLLGALLRRKGDIATAESLYHDAIAIGRRTLGEVHPDLAHHVNGLALVMRDKGNYAVAETLSRRVLAIRRQALGEEHEAIAVSLTQLGALFQHRKDYAAAEPYLLRGFAMRRKLLGDRHPHVAESAAELVALYEAWGRPEQARAYRRLLATAKPTR